MVSRPELRRPILVAAFRGWNDGGQGASLAAGYLARLWHATRFADVDPEEFFDFQVNRPQVALADVRGRDRGVRAGAGDRRRGHAGLIARGRPAHAALAGHR